MIVLVWIHLSMIYLQNETLRTNFGLGTLTINTLNFLCCFYYSQTPTSPVYRMIAHMSNMHF
uniref:Uncharacterized protein n=1 Tax=Octopus bimaculoides TaxID=37653 RepID=A0A0L8HE25_OCTBM